MPSLKKRIAQAQVKLRRRQQAKEEKRIQQLQKQRNKALKDANRLIVKAQAREDAKDAQLQKSQAKARLSRTKNQAGKKALQQLGRGSAKLLKDLRGMQEKKSPRRRKAAKKRK